MDTVLLRQADWRVEAQKADIARSHTHTLRRLFEDETLAVDAVLCLDRRPTLCVLDGRKLSDTDVEQVRRRLWNLGATTLLLVEMGTAVHLYSTIAKPSRQDESGANAQLAEETIADLETAALAQNLTQLIRRIETGVIYRDYIPRFNPAQAIDRELLDNLKAVRDVLCPDGTFEKLQQAHRFIGRFLFSCYLLDRGIVGPPYLAAKNLPEATDMQGLLNIALLPANTLEQLFNALHRDFNGSLFGEPVQRDSISSEQVDVLRRLLAGENLRTGQRQLPFKLYDFSYVPVELISSIYEEFLGAEASAAAKPKARNQPKHDAQRASGAYYTPPRLAELTVDIATEGWSTLLDKRCLDPACGSGIFLVILFVRMAEEWRLRFPEETKIAKARYDGLLRLLEHNLHGIDIQLTACLVSCFSLYLAFLDQMEPKEIRELRDELERAVNAKILPRILWERGQEKPRSRDRHFPTVRDFDFFEMETSRQFDLVIGNPPWVSRKLAKNVEAWLYSEKNVHAAELGWTTELKKPSNKLQQTLFPARELGAAFMWKASLHTKTGGRVCQVMPSRVFLSNNTDAFQAEWLSRHRLESVWLLADYSFVLFPTADCPCFVGRHTRLEEGATIGDFEFVTPKVEHTDPRAASLPVQPEDQKTLSQSALVLAAHQGKAAAAWKQYHWGTSRDIRLLERLFKLPRLNDLAARPPRMMRVTERKASVNRKTSNQKRWWKGQGYQPLGLVDDTDDQADDNNAAIRENAWKPWWPKTHLYFDANTKPEGMVLSLDRRDATSFGDRSPSLRRTLAPALTKPPLVLVNKGFSTVCFSDHPVVFRHAMQSISGPPEDRSLLMFLAAYLDSPLAKYLAFHSAANLGIERDEVHLEEIMALPFPLPAQTLHPDRSKQIVAECGRIVGEWDGNLKNTFRDRDTLRRVAREKLFEQISEYFGLCDWERDLINDTVNIFRPSSTPGSLESETLVTTKPTQRSHREEYAETLMRTFEAWTRGKKVLWVEGHLATRSGLALVTLGTGGERRDYTEQEASERVEEVTRAIRNATTEGGTVFHKLRGFAYYEADRVHLLKPLVRRHWTRTAALNDADEILSRMMEESGWGA